MRARIEGLPDVKSARARLRSLDTADACVLAMLTGLTAFSSGVRAMSGRLTRNARRPSEARRLGSRQVTRCTSTKRPTCVLDGLYGNSDCDWDTFGRVLPKARFVRNKRCLRCHGNCGREADMHGPAPRAHLTNMLQLSAPGALPCARAPGQPCQRRHVASLYKQTCGWGSKRARDEVRAVPGRQPCAKNLRDMLVQAWVRVIVDSSKS